MSSCDSAGGPAARCRFPCEYLSVRADRRTSRQGETLRAIPGEGQLADLVCTLLLRVPPLLQVLDQLAGANSRVAGVGGLSVEFVLLDLEQRGHGVAHVLAREEPAEAEAERARVVERVVYL